MDFNANKEPQIKEMLDVIGAATIEELFCDVPKEIRLKAPQADDGLSEFEGISVMRSIGAENSYTKMESYLGAGAYEHHVPALAQAICQKSEFLTAYTPYQAEASQGMLQAIFEFQSAVCALTGLDVANASLYDGSSACAEALLMALRQQKGRKKIFIAGTLHPHYRQVVDQYLENQEIQVLTIPFSPEGLLSEEFIDEYLDEDTAAVLVQYPNFLGSLDDVQSIFAKASSKGALNVVCANPLVYGLFQSAAELGADIAVGDCQPLGIALQFGGPYAGYIACKEKLVRQLPGRLVGETVDTNGKRGFVLTLQAREQHIRREKATSNICTNQSLCMLSSLVTMLWYGREGIKELALANYQRAHYLKEALDKLEGVSAISSGPHFNEFAVRFDRPLRDVIKTFREYKIEPGLPLERYFPSCENTLLIAVTETKNKKQLDRYVDVCKMALANFEKEMCNFER